jgi:multidrug transporter EmrE-like cation transporter
MTAAQLLGTIAALFAALLLVLPALRVAQQRLALRHAVGLWISGAGFLMLALAALVLRGGTIRIALLTGIVLAVAGNIMQRHLTRPERP